MHPTHPFRLPLLALALALPLALGACSGPRSGLGPEQPSEEIRRFRETHIECDRQFFREPCQIGPDGRLYKYNPGEKGYGSKN